MQQHSLSKIITGCLSKVTLQMQKCILEEEPPPLWSCSDLLCALSRSLKLLTADAVGKLQTQSYW